MTRQVAIKVNAANALKWLGTLYRNPADALKEHVSNAIDEHLKRQALGEAPISCLVNFTFTKKSITVEYPYGMDQREFENALQRVADSAKKRADFAQIGQMGIGIFSFQQIGHTCDFFSKKAVGFHTIHVRLREGIDSAEIQRALKRETLRRPGIRIVISDLKFDPLKPRGPLAPDKLTTILSQKFDGHLRRGWLRIEIKSAGHSYNVAPQKIELPKVANGLEHLHIPGDPKSRIVLSLYFDPSAKGSVAIRHAGVVVVEDLKTISAYGLEESILASGYVRGFIDADFLQPLPARTGFQEDDNWLAFIETLERQCRQIEAEVEELREKEQERTLSEIQRRAVELARDILDDEDFRDLELLGGLAKRRREVSTVLKLPLAGIHTGAQSKGVGNKRQAGGLRINYVERPFETGPALHSRFIGGQIQANELNPDFIREMKGPHEARLAYATLLIGKETISYNDKTGGADDYLEKLLGFYFKLKDALTPRTGIAGKRAPGRPRKLVAV